MKQDFSWNNSAQHYVEIYQKAIYNPAPNPLTRNPLS
jgi:glycogen synthase